ncbi:MAG: hypothetical protein KY434_05315 [Actinobacteria bacterium]|nr:hypothetical protein [Actinomycetota bacterium]
MVGVLVTVAVVAVGLVVFLTSPAYRLHGPIPALQQLDLLYLDEPAPLAARLRLRPGDATLLVICRGCAPPAVDAAVVVSADPAVAEAYGLRTAEGAVGPGYAVIDAELRVRYRTFDPRLSVHAEEIAVLLGAVR